MHETADDLSALQRLLDESWNAAGPHLKNVFSPDLRVPATELAALLPGVQVLTLAVIVHGRAREIDAATEDGGGFHRYLLETYGDGWADWGAGSPYAVIDAERMFARLWRG